MRIEGKAHFRGGWLRFKRELAIDFFDRSGLEIVEARGNVGDTSVFF